MTPEELQRSLSDREFLQELHHLLWLDPHVNEGVQDDGWNCRDHALVVAGIARMMGFITSILLGKATFIQTKTDGSRGVGREVKTHAWVGVEKAGFYDLSLRLTSFEDCPDWEDWHTLGLLGQGFNPSGEIKLSMVRSHFEFENTVNASTHLKGTKSAVYFAETMNDLNAEIVANGLAFCNSPLTDILRERFGERQDLHAKAIVHLVNFLNCKNSSLVGLSQMDAWEKLAISPGDAVYRVCSRGKLK